MKPLRESLFSKRPGLLSLIFYIIGIQVAILFDITYIIPLIISIALLFIAAFTYLKGNNKVASLIVVLLLISLGWYLTLLDRGPFPPNHIGNLAKIGGQVELYGSVSDEPDIRADKTYLVINSDSIKINNVILPALGKLRASVKESTNNFGYGDRLDLKGYLYEPPGESNPNEFNYNNYLKNKEIFACIAVGASQNITVIAKQSSFISTVIGPLRNYLISKSKEHLSPLSAALLSGFILGEKQDIPSEYQRLFSQTGTMHLMAVSGSNVAIVLATFGFVMTLLHIPRKLKIVFLLGVIVFFAILTRLEASVIRASIMAAVGLVAYGWMRKPDYINLLGFSGLLMLLISPLKLFDVGLQLSFAATFGILYTLPEFSRLLSGSKGIIRKWSGYVGAAFLTTLSAQATVMPLMPRYFQNIPLSGVLANIPIGLLASISTIGGIAFYISSIFGNWLCHLIAVPLNWIFNLIIALLKFFVSLPCADIKTASPPWPIIILCWILLYFGYELIVRRRLSKRTAVTGLLVLNIVIWNHALKPRPDWTLEFLDIGRSHAWIFSGRDYPTMASYDIFEQSDNDRDLFADHLTNFYNGELDYLFSSTPESSQIKAISEYYHCKVISLHNIFSKIGGDSITRNFNWGYDVSRELPKCVKVVWDSSDNRIRGEKEPSAIEIRTPEGTILLADWIGAGALKGLRNYRSTKILELPWSCYAQSEGLELINEIDPDYLIYSPDRFSMTAPRNREQLTHSEGKTLSASLCGGFAISGVRGALKLETMKPITVMRK
jgi:ComEC/Rec2-related protein